MPEGADEFCSFLKQYIARCAARPVCCDRRAPACHDGPIKRLAQPPARWHAQCRPFLSMKKKKTKKGARKARKTIAKAAKAVAGLVAVFAVSVVGAAASHSITTRARALVRPARERLSRVWEGATDRNEVHA